MAIDNLCLRMNKKQEPVRFLRINSFKFNLKLKQNKFFNVKE
jgi:hypothetical protein